MDIQQTDQSELADKYNLLIELERDILNQLQECRTNLKMLTQLEGVLTHALTSVRIDQGKLLAGPVFSKSCSEG